MFEREFSVYGILFEEGEGVTESSTSVFCNYLGSGIFGLDSFLSDDESESVDDICFGDFPEVEPERSRSDSLRNLIDFCGREDELHMCRWFFERLEQRVKSPSREHMHLIYDIDLVSSLIRLESCLLDKVTDIVHSSIRRSIYLDDIEHSRIIKGETIRTCMTWIAISEIGTIHPLCEYASARCLTGST